MNQILIVDSTPANITLLKELLDDTYHISTAASGEQALETAKEDPPDLILLDTKIPKMDGYQVCQRLKASEETASIPIIFMTAQAENEDVQKGLDLGAVDFINKPISPALTLARIKNHMELKKMRDLLFKVTEHSMKLRRRMSDFECRDKMNQFHLKSGEDTSNVLMVSLPMGRT